jgi:hypothetical protein
MAGFAALCVIATAIYGLYGLRWRRRTDQGVGEAARSRCSGLAVGACGPVSLSTTDGEKDGASQSVAGGRAVFGV